ncbi:MAG: hypothetical protein ACWA5T_03065 [Parvularcula sp.]
MMGALGTLMATATVAVGVVAAVKAAKRRINRAVEKRSQRREGGATIDLQADSHSGVWRDPKAAGPNL